MLKKLAALLLVALALAAVAYMGHRDGREHAGESAPRD